MLLINLSHRPKPRPLWWRGWVTSIFIFALLVICVKPPSDEPTSSASDSKSLSSSTSTHTFVEGDVIVKCDLTTPFEDESETSANGTLDITVHRGLAPLASNAFLDLVMSKHFDRNYLFRVVKGFVVQWGIESPKANKPGRVKFPMVDIDPPPAAVSEKSLRSNVRGALNFAGGNSATGQVYVNWGTNPHLDKEPGSLPFATLDERSMAIIDSVYSYKAGLGQVNAVTNGDDDVKRLFPRMSMIEKCWIDRPVEKLDKL
jgi:cyclophilin family peptidyl-prolyl cis-trans isomerase